MPNLQLRVKLFRLGCCQELELCQEMSEIKEAPTHSYSSEENLTKTLKIINTSC